MDLYDLSENDDFFAVTLMLSRKMIQDLNKYSEFHGRESQVDIRLRLARSLEREETIDTVHRLREGMTYLNFTPAQNTIFSSKKYDPNE